MLHIVVMRNNIRVIIKYMVAYSALHVFIQEVVATGMILLDALPLNHSLLMCSRMELLAMREIHLVVDKGFGEIWTVMSTLGSEAGDIGLIFFGIMVRTAASDGRWRHTI